MSLFVTFEGPEGSGKTTQMQVLAAYLHEQGSDVLTTREPGSTPIGERVRSILLDPVHTEMLPATEFLLFSAARAQHVGQVIGPHLAKGGIVFSDRYADSSMAYQGYGHQLELDVLQAVSHFATSGLAPDWRSASRYGCIWRSIRPGSSPVSTKTFYCSIRQPCGTAAISPMAGPAVTKGG